MSISKLILSDSFDFSDAAVSLVPLHSRGVDQSWLVKRASFSGMFTDFLSGFQPIPGKTVIHVLAVGDEEYYGPNRNCDAFSRSDNVNAYRTFEEMANVYRHHKHDDPLKAVGDVIKAGHNALMSRIELLLALDNEKCRSELDTLDRGGDIPVSMGSMQDYDVCSVCKHRAPTSDKHCSHIKNMLGMVLSDGRKVYMKNPNPKYFDISLVFKPADRIAYTLKKVAADNGVAIGGHELAAALGIRGFGSPKTATLKTLAHIYKQIPSSIRKSTVPEDLPSADVAVLKKKAAIHGLQQVLGYLTKMGCLLSPGNFAEIIGHKDPEVAARAVEAYDGLEQLLESPTDTEALSPPAAQDHIPLHPNIVTHIHRMTSMDPAPATARVMKVTIAKPVVKVATVLTPETEGLALLYNNYKLAFATAHSDDYELLKNIAATF